MVSILERENELCSANENLDAIHAKVEAQVKIEMQSSLALKNLYDKMNETEPDEEGINVFA